MAFFALGDVIAAALLQTGRFTRGESHWSGITPEAFETLLRDDTKRWTEVIRAANIKAE